MNPLTRLIAMLILWGAVTAIAMTAIIQMPNQTTALALVITATVASAAYTSSLIWRGAVEAEAPAGKAKRATSRVGQMLAALSEDEVYELRARLLADEGDSLADLMTGQDAGRRWSR